MAETATPSAVALSTIDADPQPLTKLQKSRPEKPDEAAYKEDLSQAEKAYLAAQEKLNSIKAKIDLAQPRNNDSPTSKKAQELKAELATIRQQQSGYKWSRGSVQDKIAALDAQLKSRINEQKIKRSQVPYKSVEDIDREIQRQEKIAESSTAMLVDQKKAIAEQSNLRKQKKAFGTFDEAQRGIDNVKAQITELKKALDNPEAKALSQRYDQVDKELKTIKAEQDEAYKSLHALREEQNKAYSEQKEKYSSMREIKDQYHKARIAYRDYEQEQYRIRQAKQKEERDAYHREKRKKIAEQKLEEASQPAYMDEILTAEGLIGYFDPSSAEASKKSLRGPSGFAAEALRSVDTSSEIKGMKVMRKRDNDDNYFMGTGGKKGKKGKKGSVVASPAPGTPPEGKFNLSIGVIENLAKVNVEPPMSQSGVPAVVEKLKEKRDGWKSEQEKKTKENIAKAQKEIEQLEAEAKESHPTSSGNRRTHEIAKKPATANQSVNGTPNADIELAQENDAVDDIEQVMKEVSMDDKVES
ncbi:MAG: hypothetical protein Q9217_006754 [Psora testacea]